MCSVLMAVFACRVVAFERRIISLASDCASTWVAAETLVFWGGAWTGILLESIWGDSRDLMGMFSP